MKTKISFILNDRHIETEINPAVAVLDFIRNERLKGTKEGCKEGDCGACTVLSGEIINGSLEYKSVNSCLLPIGNINGKHIVTIEGLNRENYGLNPVQEAFVEEGASQCGFCTPGFIVSMTGYFMNSFNREISRPELILDGNICRCTGHNSIIRAAEKVSDKFKSEIFNSKDRIKYLVDCHVLPEYFLSIKERLEKINTTETVNQNYEKGLFYFIGGGTDLFVQKPDEMLKSGIKLLHSDKNLSGIEIKEGNCIIGSNTTVSDIQHSEIIKNIFPEINKFAELFGSTPIRNNATVGGNINNASPIGDMTNFFMALNSIVTLTDGTNERDISLKEFYLGYKKTVKESGEIMKSIKFRIPEGNYFFNFEKVSKRTYLDIASVNSSVLVILKGNLIDEIHMSGGGVFATPLYLQSTCGFLAGKELNPDNLKEAVSIAQKEIAPISDARGTAVYKKLLLTRLIFTHFITLFPEIFSLKDTYERL